ncbi:MAG: exodeoxyribonuclease III [Oceanococcaceae bacterium]
MKLATWNVNSLKARLDHVQQWLAEAQPDIVGLQETKTIDENFPHEAIAETGYHVVRYGQKSYNGVALLSRETEPDAVWTGLSDGQARVIAATIGSVRVVNCYVVNGQSVGSDKYDFKLRWLEELQARIAQEIREHPHVVVMGDFNIAPFREDTHDPDKWEGHILCSDAERAALQGLMDLGLVDAFDAERDGDNRFTWWDYRAAGFRRNLGLRIDHILLSPALHTQVRSWAVDKIPRKWEKPSDHAPVIVELG